MKLSYLKVLLYLYKLNILIKTIYIKRDRQLWPFWHNLYMCVCACMYLNLTKDIKYSLMLKILKQKPVKPDFG